MDENAQQVAAPPATETWHDRKVIMPDALYRGNVRAWHVGAMDHSEPVAPHEMTIGADQFRHHPTLYSHWQPVSRPPMQIVDYGVTRSREAITGDESLIPGITEAGRAHVDGVAAADETWKELLTAAERKALEVVNAALDDEDHNNADLGDLCCYQVPVLIDAMRRLARRNHRLLTALETIADTIVHVAGDE